MIIPYKWRNMQKIHIECLGTWLFRFVRHVRYVRYVRYARPSRPSRHVCHVRHVHNTNYKHINTVNMINYTKFFILPILFIFYFFFWLKKLRKFLTNGGQHWLSFWNLNQFRWSADILNTFEFIKYIFFIPIGLFIR